LEKKRSTRRARSAGSWPQAAPKVALAAVAVSIVCVVTWTALPLVRPAREVTVVQAVFVRSDPTAASPELGQELRDDARDVPTVQAPGWLEAEPFYVACTALADGVVESIDVLEGDYVERGDVVARLVAEDSEIRLRLVAAELENTRAELRMAHAERSAAAEVWEEPVELERAAATGRAAVAESEAELAQLPSLIEAAEATLTRLAEEATRARQSRSQGASTELEVIVAVQNAAAQRAEVRALEQRQPLLEARAARLRAELHAAERQLDLRTEDRRRLEAAEAAVSTAEAAIARAEARYAEAQLELDRMAIRAPISGYVQRRLKVPGDKVIRMMDSPHSAHIVHLYNPEHIRVRVDVPLADASHVFVGQRCEVVVEVLPDRVFTGTVLRTTHEADLQKNTLEIQVEVHDPDPFLRPEMLTRVKFLPPSGSEPASLSAGQDEETEVLIPGAAIDGGGEDALVWVVRQRRNGRGSLASVPVVVVSTEGDWARVRGGILPGDLIAVGIQRPQDGERVAMTTGSIDEKGGPS